MNGKQTISAEERRQRMLELGEICREDDRMLIYQAAMSDRTNQASRERELRRLIDLVMPPEHTRDAQREVLLMCVARGMIGDYTEQVILALDAASNSQNLIKELLSVARIRFYSGSRRTDCQYQQDTGMWHMSLTADAKQTLPVLDFLQLLDL